MRVKKNIDEQHSTRNHTEEWRATSKDAEVNAKKKWEKKWVAEINKKCQYRRLLTPILNVVYIERKKQHFQIASHTVSGMAIWTQKNRGETKHEHAHTDTASPQQSGLFNYYVYDRRLEVIHFLLLASRWMTQKKRVELWLVPRIQIAIKIERDRGKCWKLEQTKSQESHMHSAEVEK